MENFDLNCAKNKKNISTNKKRKLNYKFFTFYFKIIGIFNNPKNKIP